jgi:SAM-dependent methyltransferase
MPVDDGDAYERAFGVWGRLTGEIFLGWLAPSPGLRWVDVGCGTGAFTELIVQRCVPAEAQGIDLSESQLAFARTRPAARVAKFRQGDAMALPYADDSFDAAVMAQVLSFVPQPVTGVAEMVRVVRPGGLVAAYLWDFDAGVGFPFAPIRVEMRAMGMTPLEQPSVRASRMDVLHDLWAGAGLTAIESRTITVSRSFASFEEFWAIMAAGAEPMRAAIGEMAPANVEQLKTRVRARLPADADGQITLQCIANAIKGRVSV